MEERGLRRWQKEAVIRTMSFVSMFIMYSLPSFFFLPSWTHFLLVPVWVTTMILYDELLSLYNTRSVVHGVFYYSFYVVYPYWACHCLMHSPSNLFGGLRVGLLFGLSWVGFALIFKEHFPKAPFRKVVRAFRFIIGALLIAHVELYICAVCLFLAYFIPSLPIKSHFFSLAVIFMRPLKELLFMISIPVACAWYLYIYFYE